MIKIDAALPLPAPLRGVTVTVRLFSVSRWWTVYSRVVSSTNITACLIEIAGNGDSIAQDRYPLQSKRRAPGEERESAHGGVDYSHSKVLNCIQQTFKYIIKIV